jgi:signal transduction histidine kinase
MAEEALRESRDKLEERVLERTADLEKANKGLEATKVYQEELIKKLKEAQNQLLQSEKMAAIGQLAAGVAHEINNPVGFVNSNLGSLKIYADKLLTVVNAYESNDPAQISEARQKADLEFLRQDLPSLLAESQEGLGRVTKIVQDLKDFSHVDHADRQIADLNAAMESTLNVVWNELKYKAEVIRELGEIPSVDCVPAQINQVFMNLLVNAAQAIPKQGKIFVRSGLEKEQVWFEVEDTGSGMSSEVQQRIFEPFFTTKPVGKGTGLGLSISYDIIVKKHHGRMDVNSEIGKGSRFRLWLPLVFTEPG